MPTVTASTSEMSSAVRAVYADALSQAVTGELIGMLNYSSMAHLYEDMTDVEDAIEHADSERRHAAAFRRAARDLGVEIIEDVRAPYWGRVRDAFLVHVERGDRVACTVIQEIMLESFAVALYDAVAEVTEGKLGSTFGAIAAEEEDHIEHAIDELRAELENDRDGFEEKVNGLHNEVMTVLAEMVSKKDIAGPCGLCADGCVKDALHLISLDAPTLRGKALNLYLRLLDRIGIRGEKSLEWVANLPV